ncbi:phage holin family protein [Parvimonas sp. G1641]|uniref:phage holin family protein n=1 Tax=Parvimonas sp. G1641 TaxID=3388846 RepID=UPI0039816944
MMIEFLRELTGTQDAKIFFILGLIAIAMIIDFLTGIVSAKINQNIISQKGINGILRKICSMIVMIYFIPVSILIPEGIGIGLVYVLYLGYLMMEIKSILENLKKMGLDVTLFKTFVDEVEKNKK